MKRSTFLLAFLAPILVVSARTVTCRIERIDGRHETHAIPLDERDRLAAFRLASSVVGRDAKSVELLPDFARADKGEAGYFVTPEGLLGTFRADNGRLVTAENRNYMPIYGMKTPRAAFVAIVKGMRWRYETRVAVTNGHYQMSQLYRLDGDVPYEDFAIDFHFLDASAGYPEMARAYRAEQLARGACRPLRERMTRQPELATAVSNVEIRIRQAWKHVPSAVPFQTPFNEPPVHAAVTFGRCGDIVRELKRQGVDSAEICLVGWNRGGHDGAYPQLFPVEPALGGEEGLRAFVALSNGLGYQTVCHTCFFSAYTIADGFDEECLLRERDGSLQCSKTDWGGGRPFRTCPRRAHEKWSAQNLAALADLGFHGLHYHDVYSIYPPPICHDPRHPCTPCDSISWIGRQMTATRNALGGVQSEGPFDHFIGDLDYALYVNFYPLEGDDLRKKPLADRIVPFWELVYHGIVLYNPFTGTLNATVKAPHKQLKLVEFGGRPLFVWHANFVGGNGNWMGKEDLTCETDEALVRGVAAIRCGANAYRRLADLQLAFMDDHRELAPGVALTGYSDGTRIIVNATARPFTGEGVTVPAMDWVRIDSGEKQNRRAGNPHTAASFAKRRN